MNELVRNILLSICCGVGVVLLGLLVAMVASLRGRNDFERKLGRKEE